MYECFLVFNCKTYRPSQPAASSSITADKTKSTKTTEFLWFALLSHVNTLLPPPISPTTTTTATSSSTTSHHLCVTHSMLQYTYSPWKYYMCNVVIFCLAIVLFFFSLLAINISSCLFLFTSSLFFYKYLKSPLDSFIIFLCIPPYFLSLLLTYFFFLWFTLRIFLVSVSF